MSFVFILNSTVAAVITRALFGLYDTRLAPKAPRGACAD